MIERELGGGGMSRVFVAIERALDRPVVVKVLAPELAASVSAERFAREIRLAAHLQQANIVPLLAAGEIAGVRPGDARLPYYTMPLVEGESLRRRIAEGGPMPFGTIVHVLRDIARALAYAHEHGVVHRDIKPENVLLSGETAVVTDFGIAKALSESRTLTDAVTLTSVGSSVGTPQYMSPEQLTGDASADHRTDIYAFGCLAYELLAGRPPFHGLSVQRLFAAHISETPAPVETLRTDAPAGLAALVMRCLAKDPDARPQSARVLLDALDQVTTPNFAQTGPGLGRPRAGSSRRWAAAAIGATVMALATLGLIRLRRAGPVKVAVLPFVNVGGDSSQEYFADGMSVSLTNALSRISGLQITARSLAFTFKGKSMDVRHVGSELGVSAVLEGTVQRAGSRLRVTAQLTNTKDGAVRWTETYERKIEDLFAVQDTITQAIVAQLRGKLTGDASGARRHAAGTTNLEAYDRYVRGVSMLDRRGPGVAQSVDLFNAAIALDSAFAPAYGKLSVALELLPYFTPTPAASVEHRAMVAAGRALGLDSMIAEAHIGLALAHGHAYRWADAEREYRLGLALDSSSAEAQMQYGRHLMHLGRFADAIVHERTATRLDPLWSTPLVWLAHNYALLGQNDSALAIARRVRAMDPGLRLVQTITALDLAWAGQLDEARALASVADASAAWMGQASFAFAALGDTTTVRRILRDIERIPNDTWMVHSGRAFAFLAARDTGRALDEMEAARRANEITAKWMSFADRVYDPVRASPRFAAIARSFGLDDSVVSRGRRAR